MIHFELVSTTGTKFDDEAYEILIPTQGGTIAIFEDHMPLISAAHPGVISIRKKATDKDDDMQSFAVNGGVMEVDGKNLRFIADDITAPEDISEKEAEAALARAEDLVKNAGTQSALVEAHRMLHTSRAQLNVSRLKRRHYN
ncbi:ATP synthase F1 subunit epsilon [Candidatus Saccharibacteria bacterium]|nr:ATP synthase F1 subunit epsilon [Candidatus Saccharibacteria bacterium]